MNLNDLTQLTPEERNMQLRAMACKVEEGTFFKKFTQDEVDAAKDGYTDMQIELGDAEEQFKDYTKDFREKLKSLKTRNKTMLQNIRQGGYTASGITYFIADQENSKMLQVDADGNIVSQRRLRPDEKQINSFTVTLKKASND